MYSEFKEHFISQSATLENFTVFLNPEKHERCTDILSGYSSGGIITLVSRHIAQNQTRNSGQELKRNREFCHEEVFQCINELLKILLISHITTSTSASFENILKKYPMRKQI